VQWALVPPIDALFWRWCRRRGWRIVYTAHEAARGEAAPRPLLQPGGSRLLHLADAVIVHSSAERALMAAKGVDTRRIQVIPDGPAGLFQGAQVDSVHARRLLDVPAGAAVILFFGLIKPYKGLEVLLRSLPQVLSEHPSAHLVIAGEPMMSTAPLQAWARAAGLEAHITWRLGYVPSPEATLWFSACDVVALPYLSAAGSGVLTRAFGFRRPVVASAVGALADIVKPGVNGELTPPNDPEALAAALGRSLAGRHAMGRAGDQGTECSWDTIAGLTARLYEQVTAVPATAPMAGWR
jgi:glycosyltransferase involved in cell wall biosynthesis